MWSFMLIQSTLTSCNWQMLPRTHHSRSSMHAHAHTHMHTRTCTNVHPLVFYLSLYTELDFVNVSYYMHLEKSSIYWDPIFSRVYNGDNKTYISRVAEKLKRNNNWFVLALSDTGPCRGLLPLALRKFLDSLYAAIRWLRTVVDLVPVARDSGHGKIFLSGWNLWACLWSLLKCADDGLWMQTRGALLVRQRYPPPGCCVDYLW